MVKKAKTSGRDKPPVLDVIETRHLPSMCPSCTNPEIQVGRPTETGAAMVSCGRCGWFARYRVRVPEVEATNG